MTPSSQTPCTAREVVIALARALAAGVAVFGLGVLFWLFLKRNETGFTLGTAWFQHGGSSLAATSGGVMARMLIDEYSKRYELNGLFSKIILLLFFVGSIWTALELGYQLFNLPTEYPLLAFFVLLLSICLAFRFGELRPNSRMK